MPYQLVYDTLILREPDGELSPMLATEWNYNDDRTVLTVDLRTDVSFSDGEPFDAEAVVANLEHFKAGNGRQAVQLTQFESATAVDEDTVEINLAQPDPAMEYYLSQAAGLMASPAAIEAGTLETDPIGTGPYLYDKANSVRDSQSLFTAKEDYWNPDLQKLDEVELRILVDISARVNAIISGQVDWTTLEAKSADQAEDAGLEIIPDYQVDWTGMTFLDRDGVINPALADERVRQAINYAVDRDTLLEQLQLGRGTATSQVFGPDSGAFVDDLEEYYTYDPEKAKELMEEAGYEDGFELKLPVIPAFATQITALAQQLGEIGITVTQETVPPANYVARTSCRRSSKRSTSISSRVRRGWRSTRSSRRPRRSTRSAPRTPSWKSSSPSFSRAAKTAPRPRRTSTATSPRTPGSCRCTASTRSASSTPRRSPSSPRRSRRCPPSTTSPPRSR